MCYWKMGRFYLLFYPCLTVSVKLYILYIEVCNIKASNNNQLSEMVKSRQILFIYLFIFLGRVRILCHYGYYEAMRKHLGPFWFVVI